jgi:hypothetical protein
VREPLARPVTATLRPCQRWMTGLQMAPRQRPQNVSVELTPQEAQELLEALDMRAKDDFPNPGWHLHIGPDAEGRELTIWVTGDAVFGNRVANLS